MAKYTVLMTFEAPGLRAGLERKHTSMRLLASDGRVAVTAAGVRADTPSEAAMQVTTEVSRRLGKSAGPLKLASWRADRERVLAGVLGRRSNPVLGQGSWIEGPDEDEGGSAGVREPRRPKPGPGSMSMEADLP